MRKVPLTPESKGSEEIPEQKCRKCGQENVENAADWLQGGLALGDPPLLVLQFATPAGLAQSAKTALKPGDM